ncbi:peritrophin-1-like [Pararge aegeria]|uniref:peritrophin-1-like n=1 Tax=Pararge aegeria TaxID=116150 RepID=UPI0019D05C32|nr:peritrophin-1-like [Pararge aegeria]
MGVKGEIFVLIVFALVVEGITFAEARSKDIPIRNPPVQNIPVRCITNTVTKVSCDNVTVSDNLVPHPDDCQLFYYCVTAYLPPICRQCPAGLHFNPQKHVCDLPEQAGCQSNFASTSEPSNEQFETSTADYYV